MDSIGDRLTVAGPVHGSRIHDAMTVEIGSEIAVAAVD